MSENRVTIVRLEQTEIWQLRHDYGECPYCFQCRKPLLPGDLIIKVRGLKNWRLPRLYHCACFGSARVDQQRKVQIPGPGALGSSLQAPLTSNLASEGGSLLSGARLFRENFGRIWRSL